MSVVNRATGHKLRIYERVRHSPQIGGSLSHVAMAPSLGRLLVSSVGLGVELTPDNLMSIWSPPATHRQRTGNAGYMLNEISSGSECHIIELYLSPPSPGLVPSSSDVDPLGSSDHAILRWSYSDLCSPRSTTRMLRKSRTKRRESHSSPTMSSWLSSVGSFGHLHVSVFCSSCPLSSCYCS